jgi:hypothetical protein
MNDLEGIRMAGVSPIKPSGSLTSFSESKKYRRPSVSRKNSFEIDGGEDPVQTKGQENRAGGTSSRPCSRRNSFVETMDENLAQTQNQDRVTSTR